jgi:quinol monooxygenase YgiN
MEPFTAARLIFRGDTAAVAIPEYGTHGRIVAKDGRGDELAAILREAAAGLEANPDCRLYLVSRALDDPDSIWVTEAWTHRSAHAASLADPAARALIERARPIIASFADRAEFRPEGGKGLPPHSS